MLQDGEVAHVVAAENSGLAPRDVPHQEVELVAKIGAGAEGRVFRARWRGKQVAVKVVPLQKSGARDATSMLSVVATSHLASVSSDYVCKLHGVCRRKNELWCAACSAPLLGPAHRLSARRGPVRH
jgi:hypothetical protein